MKKPLLFLVFLCQCSITASAQHEADNWYFYDNAGISFQSGSPVALSSGQLNSQGLKFGEGCATISDKTTGSLLFYTDGVTVWNSNHQVMKNGTGLKGGISSTQSALIVPNPINKLQYYIFTVSDVESGESKLYYSLVSLEITGGEVLAKNTFLLDGVSEKLTGTLDCFGTGFWIVTHLRYFSTFYTFHLTSTGVEASPVISNYVSRITDYRTGYMKISPNRAKISLASGISGGYLFLFDFNAVTGEISNSISLVGKGSTWAYGVTFSPDNTKLYVASDALDIPTFILQYEINLSNPTLIHNSVTVINTYSKSVAALQLGPDGKIYMPRYGSAYLDVIDYPNRKGIACNYRANAVGLTNRSMNGLPNFMDYNFGYSTDTAVICPGGSSQIGAPPLAGFSYSWTPSDGLDNTNISNPTASPSQTTEYHLKVVNSTGCESNQTFVVKVDVVKATIEPISPICLGASLRLSASGGDTYLWSPTIGLDTVTKATPLASPKVSTRYKVIVSRGDCTDSAFVDVEVIAPQAKAGQDKITCTGGSVQIGDSVSKSGESYTWTPSEGLNNTIIPNPIASPTKTTKYILEVYRSGCIAYDTVVVTVVPNTKAVVSKDTSICGGASVQLSASGGSAYSWFPVIGLNNPSISNPIASPIVTTKYRVLVSNDNCIDSAFVIVTVTAFSGAQAGADKTVCPGASTELGAPSEVGNTYSWQPPVNLDDATKSNPTVTPSGNGTTEYMLAVTSKNGCTAFDTVLVTAGSITAKASSDSAMCIGSRVQLLASGGSDYDWSPSTGLDNPNIPNPIASPIVTTTYKVRVSSGSCEDFDSVTVTVNPIPIANAGADQTSCMGETIQLGASPQDGYTYQWQPEAGLNDPTKSNPNATPTVTTEYTLTVTNSGGCSSKDTVLVTVGNIEAIVSGDTSVCAGASVQLSASGGSTYKWSPIDGLDNPSSANPIATPSSTTDYTVVVSSGFCIDSTTVRVTLAPAPIANAGADRTPCKGDTLELRASPQDGNTYNWQPVTGLDNPTKSNPQLIADENIEYILIVTNPTGCVSQDTVLVTVNPPSEHSFTLSSSTPAIIPGQSLQVSLHVPDGVSSWNASLGYDNLVMKFASVARTSTGITFDIPKEEKGELLLQNGKGGNGDIVLNYNVYLPYNSDTTFPIKLAVDNAATLPCESVSSRGITVELGIFCGRRIRTVSSTGKKYFLTNKENGVNFGVGLTGKVKLELYDYTGTLREILTEGILEAGEYSIDIELPTGVYFCRITAGMYNDVRKVMVLENQ